MFSWLFKKKTTAPAATAPAAPPQIAAQAASAKQNKQARQAHQEAAATEWSARLDKALGDDDALLALAKQAPSVDLKLAAVQALASEGALKLAEREFRTHDRRVHQLARQRHAAAKLQRETTERAFDLIKVAQALLEQSEIPVNRLAELDRGWQALDPALTLPAQQTEFNTLSAALTAQLHAQTEQQVMVKRWAAQARQTLAQLDALTGDEQASARDTAQQLLDSHPTDNGLDALHASLQSALTQAVLTSTRPAPAVAPIATEAGSDTINDASTSAEPAAQSAPAKEKPPRIAKVPTAQETAAIDDHLSQAETALAEGQLAQVQRHLQALDTLGLSSTEFTTRQRARLGSVQAEAARLKGWQQWGGGLARDELVLEAEALAKTTTAAAEAGEPIPQMQAHAQAIDELRQRWRELDRLKAAGGQPLWERFDTALQSAYVPVAAHLAQLEAERQTNLASRHTLLDALEATPLPDAGEWKDLIRALDQFQGAWRKLGPAQHTTPRKAQKALFARLETALARLEAPLQDARRTAQLEREALVAQAQAIGSQARGSDAVTQVRELQAQWQQHARALPLTRAVETALWADFKAATDAVFAQREAAFKARDAAFEAGESARRAIIEGLQALQPETPVADLKRALAESDAAWRQAGEASRANAPTLDKQWRAARAATQALIADHAQRLWHRTCDTLLDKLALCEAQEAGREADDMQARWTSLAPLPALWEHALTQRKAVAQTRPQAAQENATADATLLQLEALLDLPSPADQLEARRGLKLLTMKAALEGRPLPGGAGPSTQAVDQLTAEVLGQANLNAAQRERLHQLIAGMRAQPPRQALSEASRSR